MNMRVIDITPLEENVDIDDVYRGIRLYIEGYELRVDLMPLNLHNFDLIFGTDWLGVHRAQIDCFTKMMIIQRECGKRVVFKRERKVTQATPTTFELTKE
jgi:hypothetical protein